MNTKDLDALAEGVAIMVKSVVDGPRVHGRIEQLEARIAALEKRPAVKFCGVFEEGKTYCAGDACLHKSALWICREPTSGKPGEDFVGWQLALKRGDAR
jgi:hypothetical protein